MPSKVVRKRPDHLFPFHLPGAFLKQSEIAYQQRRIMFPVCPGKGGKKLRGQNGENTGIYRHKSKIVT
ncbi:hypothetical protein Holit_03352 [Hollandina sp. SP2]